MWHGEIELIKRHARRIAATAQRELRALAAAHQLGVGVETIVLRRPFHVCRTARAHGVGRRCTSPFEVLPPQIERQDRRCRSQVDAAVGLDRSRFELHGERLDLHRPVRVAQRRGQQAQRAAVDRRVARQRRVGEIAARLEFERERRRIDPEACRFDPGRGEFQGPARSRQAADDAQARLRGLGQRRRHDQGQIVEVAVCVDL
jgi:hypothetical protein